MFGIFVLPDLRCQGILIVRNGTLILENVVLSELLFPMSFSALLNLYSSGIL